MSAIPENTLGALVKSKMVPATCAEAIARAIFDGKRAVTVGEITVTSPSYEALTSHEQTILKGLFLKAKAQVA